MLALDKCEVTGCLLCLIRHWLQALSDLQQNTCKPAWIINDEIHADSTLLKMLKPIPQCCSKGQTEFMAKHSIPLAHLGVLTLL